ncbi:hypothetical protein PMIN06_005285 [Paraphaeosphaeria minitans]|uniref:Uncharacterized protein n=1 Tax=Paraphaeosphaeria minitans TaxID=565426 RepID=A0A9P6GNN3_9PLEO|nr:hypothetical protein PMIN01_01671 [Paraphaeosphaeria minitans]
MPATSRPDLELWLKRDAWLKKTIHPEQAYMWPQLNSHDLIKRNMFLVFLNSRGRHFGPWMWMAERSDSPWKSWADQRGIAGQEKMVLAWKSRSIFTCDPHKSKLPATWARNIGHRLAIKYGWTAETFVVE